MTIKDRFAEKYGIPKPGLRKPNQRRRFSLAEIKAQAPVVYRADDIMDPNKPHGDFLVLCAINAAFTGIYLVESKRGKADMHAVEQLRGSAEFMDAFIGDDDRFNFLPVLVAKNMPPSMRQVLNDENNRIELGMRGTRKIKHIKGGSVPKLPVPESGGK